MNAFEFSGIAQYIAEKLRLPLAVLIPLVIALLLAWVCWRTRSTHVVMSRIWRFVFGKTTQQDRELGKFIETRNRLVMFRFFSGMPKVRTLAQAKRIIHWSNLHDEELAEIKACGDLFDFENCRLKVDRIPGKKFQGLKVLCALILLIAVAFTVAGLLTESALLQFNVSKKWFLLTKDTAKPLWEEGVLTQKACAETKQKDSSPKAFSDDERVVICKAFDESDTAAFIERTVRQQRYLLSLMLLYLAYFAWMPWASFRKGLFATELQDRITKKAKSPPAKKLEASSPGSISCLSSVQEADSSIDP